METAREDADEKSIKRLYVNADEYSGEYPEKDRVIDYYPERDMDKIADDFGHGNSDFYSMYNFVRKIQGYSDADTIDVYEALDMFLPGLFAYFSVLDGGIPKEIPNLRDKSQRDKYRNDTRCTDPKVAGDQLLPCFSKGNPEIPASVYESVRLKWEKEKEEK